MDETIRDTQENQHQNENRLNAKLRLLSPEKVHFMIIVNDPAFIDLVQFHAQSKGGSPLEDSETGERYLLYPIQRKGIEGQEMALLCTSDMSSSDKVAWVDGESRREAIGHLYWNQELSVSFMIQVLKSIKSDKVVIQLVTTSQNPRGVDILATKQVLAETDQYWMRCEQVRVGFIDLSCLETFDTILNQQCERIWEL